MGIQDDIFDVEAHVKGTDVEDAFDNVYSYVALLEAELAKMQKEKIEANITLEGILKRVIAIDESVRGN